MEMGGRGKGSRVVWREWCSVEGRGLRGGSGRRGGGGCGGVGVGGERDGREVE